VRLSSSEDSETEVLWRRVWGGGVGERVVRWLRWLFWVRVERVGMGLS
jgi:hypothetical protein